MAYIDPGTGSLIIQALIAGSLGILFAVRKWLRNVFTRFFRSSATKDQDGHA